MQNITRKMPSGEKMPSERRNTKNCQVAWHQQCHPLRIAWGEIDGSALQERNAKNGQAA